MHNSESENASADAELVRSVARRLLDHHLDAIVDGAVARIVDDEPTYTGGPVSRGDLRFHMERTMRLALTRLAGGDIPEDLRSAALAVGRVRAQQGIPLSSVLHAFRIDLRSLWESLIEEGRAVGRELRADFLERSSLMVWEAIELNTAEVVSGYQAAQLSIDETRSSAFDRLLVDGEPAVESVEYAAEVLDLPVGGRYLCLVGAFPAPRPELSDACAMTLLARGCTFYLRWSAFELQAVVHLSDGRADVAELLAPLDGHVCATAPADRLSTVGRAIRLARRAVRGRSDPGVRALSDTWLNAVAAADAELADAVHAAVFGPLARLGDGERNGLIETVTDLTAHGGTIADIAQRTYRHRNTVRARLRTFADITGFDLTQTDHLATVAIAFTIERTRAPAAS
jgi:hypothetical protein